MKKNEHVLRYISIYNDLKAAILSEKYPPGTLLPTEEELVNLYSASRTTIRRAVSILKEESYVNVQQGRGTEVLNRKNLSAPYNFNKFRNVINITGKPLIEGEASTQGAVVDITPADIKTSRALSIDIGTNVYRIQRIKMIGDTIFSYVVSYVPCDLAPGLEQYSGKIFTLYKCLEENYNLSMTHADENISVDIAKFLESKVLNVPIGTPMLVFYRTAYCELGLMEYAVSYIRPDIYEIVISMQGGFDYIDEKNIFGVRADNH